MDTQIAETKICRSCGESKSLDGFAWTAWTSTGKRYRRGMCRVCESTRDRHIWKVNRDARRALKDSVASVPIQDVVFEHQVCSKCGVDQPFDQYNWTSRSVSDLRLGVRRKKAECKTCQAKYYVGYGAENRDALRIRWRRTHYRTKYGLSMERSLELADPEARIAPCPICHEIEKLVMDHDHATGKVRDMICSHCNSMLGYASESIDTLYNAVAYLKKHRGV
jgi:hypothetical protein